MGLMVQFAALIFNVWIFLAAVVVALVIYLWKQNYFHFGR